METRDLPVPSFRPEQLLSFEQAVAAVHENRAASFIALKFDASRCYLRVYQLSADEESDEILLRFEGSGLYDLYAEEELYGLRETPKEAKSLAWLCESLLPESILGMNADYGLQVVFGPTLPTVEDIGTKTQRIAYEKLIAELFAHYWRLEPSPG